MAELSSTSVKLVEVCSVAPQPQPDVAEFSLPITFFDPLWLRFPHFLCLSWHKTLLWFSTPSKTQSLTLCHPPTLPTSGRKHHLAPRLRQTRSQSCPRRRRFAHHSLLTRRRGWDLGIFIFKRRRKRESKKENSLVILYFWLDCKWNGKSTALLHCTSPNIMLTNLTSTANSH